MFFRLAGVKSHRVSHALRGGVSNGERSVSLGLASLSPKYAIPGHLLGGVLGRVVVGASYALCSVVRFSGRR